MKGLLYLLDPPERDALEERISKKVSYQSIGFIWGCL